MHTDKGPATVLIMVTILAVVVLGGAILSRIIVTNNSDGNDGKTACTQEAKLCPDGTAVGRTGPNCEFAACPGEEVCVAGDRGVCTTDIRDMCSPDGLQRKTVPSRCGCGEDAEWLEKYGWKDCSQPEPILDTSTWKTYRNEEYGFEVKYPEALLVREVEADCVAANKYHQEHCNGYTLLFPADNFNAIEKGYAIYVHKIPLLSGENWIQIVQQYFNAYVVEGNINGNEILTVTVNQSAREPNDSMFNKMVYLANRSETVIVELSLEGSWDGRSVYESLFDRMLSTFKFIP